MKHHDSDLAHESVITEQTEELKHDPAVFRNEELWSRACLLQYTLFAARKIAGRPWRRSDMDAPDVVSEANVLLLTGQRRYTTRYSPKRCVFATISNLIYHGGYAAENVIPHDSLTTYPTDEFGLIDETLLPAADPEIEEMLAAREFVEEYKLNFTNEAHRRYLDVLAAGYVSAAEAATILGVTEDEIWTYRKVIKRPRHKWPGSPPRG